MSDLASMSGRRQLRSRGENSSNKKSSRAAGAAALKGQAKSQADGHASISSKFKSYVTQPMARLMPVLFGIFVTYVLIVGWNMRGERHLTPEHGIGYWIGIVGASMMALLLLYPLRKRLKSMRMLGRIAGWFRLHMFLGVSGPVLIMFHANFKLGSLNSAMALISMLLVAFSGLVGRYFYAKIHMGLYGKKAELQTLLDDAHELKILFGAELSFAPAVHEVMQKFEQQVLVRRAGLLSSIFASMSLRRQSWRYRRQLISQAKQIIDKTGAERGLSWRQRRSQLRAAQYHIDLYFKAVRKAARLALFERLFGLWHVLHLPFFIVLVIAAIVHIIAVHLY